MPNIFHSEIVKKHAHNHARIMKMTTPHGEVITPAFMPVGTRAVVNHMTPRDLLASGSQIILGGNTYHMLCSPGLDVIKSSGGMHRFMSWNRPMLTDSGGFQVFSLSKKKEICRIDQDGGHFKHPATGKVIHLTPKTSIETQKTIGADIIMALDECTPEEGGREAAIAALERTHRWLIESKEAHEKQPLSIQGYKQALFGIIQGGSFRDLRDKSTRFILEMDLDGVAIGGEAIGFNMEKTCEIVEWIRPAIPEQKMRYTMGVGLNPQDLIDVVSKGIDIFDCVAPTRNARHGSLYHGKAILCNEWVAFDTCGEDTGRIAIKKGKYARDERPILEGCSCLTCTHFTRAYLHYLFKDRSSAYHNLACIHNVHLMHQVCDAMRESIINNSAAPTHHT
ncbi:MAG: tRNA guanosine(34) transglycosylase Tgt [Waddliaceae bacterium]